jgi:hypothetical protein
MHMLVKTLYMPMLVQYGSHDARQNDPVTHMMS